MSKLRVDILSRIFSIGLDTFESRIFGATYHHSLRLAVLSCAMLKHLGYGEQQQLSLEIAALFHDNSLSQYMAMVNEKKAKPDLMQEHCKMGKENLKWLPFSEETGDIILYHHERSDGSGAFGKVKGGYLRQAGILALLDFLDLTYQFQTQSVDNVPLLKDIIRYTASKGFDREDTELLAGILDENLILSLKDHNVISFFHAIAPQWNADIEDEVIFHIGEMFSRIVDYKSHFTNTHTKRIANVVWIMGKYYGYDNKTLHKLYLEATLHDIGKMLIPTDILDKPDQLTKEEFAVMKHHMDRTYELLSLIPDFNDAALWAANHHEKLIGGGYPKGKKAEELDFNSRLMACVDIWEALTAHRPYQKTFYDHKQALEIMHNMAAKNFIDLKIVSDLDKILYQYDGQKIPSPLGYYNY